MEGGRREEREEGRREGGRGEGGKRRKEGGKRRKEGGGYAQGVIHTEDRLVTFE